MNQEQPIISTSFPQAILHIDGDAFFTSVEQAMHPHLKGRPVVSGKERGIIACADTNNAPKKFISTYALKIINRSDSERNSTVPPTPPKKFSQ